MITKHLIISFLFLLFTLGQSHSVNAQQKGDYQLAQQYFKQGDFERAAEYYLKAYKQSGKSTYFEKYVTSLANNKDYKSAEKALKKQIKKQPQKINYSVQLGDIYFLAEEKEKANKTWDHVIKQLPNHQNNIVPIAYQFTKLNQPKYALKAYEVGKELIPGFYSYYPQMADLCGLMGDYDKMIDIYLELITINPGYQQTVQNLLNRNFDFSEDNENTQMLKQKLYKKTNENPENQMYAEMLIWLNLQQSNFNGAYIQIKSLDKRFKEKGSRLLTFARMANKNQEYAVAKKAYEAVIDKGNFTPFYEIAKIEKLSTEKALLDKDLNTSLKQYQKLCNNYKETINEFGIADFTVPAIRQFAQINAKNLNQVDISIEWLLLTLENSGISSKEEAQCKIDLGDYLIMRNQIWEAVLYYLQAEKAFKYDELGDQAKLKAAKVYYYTGDFNWAASKLDVLKGSTSKLISNDALYLSNLITDNITIDTTLHPMQMYAEADLWFTQHKYEEAYAKLDTLQQYYPEHSLMDEVFFQKYKIRFTQKRYEDAEKELTQLINQYSQDILADNAIFKLAQLYESHLNNTEKAMEYYLLLMTDHQDSVFVTEARKRYRKLRGDSV